MSNADPIHESAEPLEHPRGIYTARVDAKGRLKLPAAFVKYLSSHKHKDFFVTSTNKRSFYIYTLPQWKRVEEVIDNPDNPEEYKMFKATRHTAGKYGADATVDSEGRMLIPQLLREDLQVHDKPVWLEYVKGSIEVYGEDVYQERERESDLMTLAKSDEALALKMRKLTQ